MLREFSLSDLQSLDNGRIEVAFQQALQRVLHDCEDRPGAGDARKVVLQVEVVPVCDEDGMLADTKVAFQVKDTVPTRKSRVYSMDIRKVGGNKRQLIFNDLSDDNIDQKTIDQ